jgi:hypothetical protein
MRPIYHFKEERVKAHVAILFTAFALARHMQYRVKLQYEAMSVNTIKEELLYAQSSIYYYPPNGFRYAVPGVLSDKAKKLFNQYRCYSSVHCSILAVALSITGADEPYPLTIILSIETPFLVNKFATACALAFESLTL